MKKPREIVFSPERITALRESKRLSQIQFARSINTHRQLVSVWESGEKTPSTGSLLKIVNEFGVPVEYFFVTKVIHMGSH